MNTDPRLPKPDQMQEIAAAVQRKLGPNPSQADVDIAIEATLLERLQDAQALVNLLQKNLETYVDFLYDKLT